MTDQPNTYKRKGSRHKARQRAVDLLFEAEFRDVDPVEIAHERIELSRDQANQVRPVSDYTLRVVEGVATGLDEIDAAIAGHLSSEWSLDRLPAVDRAVLRVSVWELTENPEVPDRVAMSEGIALAEEYCHDKAPGYVNAVLDGIAREVRDRRDAAAADRQAAEDLALADAAAARREVEAAVDALVDTSDETGGSGDADAGTGAGTDATGTGAGTAATDGTTGTGPEGETGGPQA
ncbi:transcription antitermination factor NusB [Corynebacterium bovis]|nr:transcription antitermination factor NusB [Corynebacterium bovis]MDK8509819.1 transcription antitermination factor NusB [Corynebacterium bovis]